MTNRNTNTNRIGPRMEAAIQFVALNPGCRKIDVAKVVGPNGSLRYGYRTVDRCIARGLVRAERRPDGRYILKA